MLNLNKMIDSIKTRGEAIVKAKEDIERIKKAKSDIDESYTELEKDLEVIGVKEKRINEPEDFTTCVRQGGRVRTKDLGDGKFIRICFDSKGKSHAGEPMMKKDGESIQFDDDVIEINGEYRLKSIEKFSPKNDCSVQCRIVEKRIDEDKRTVVAGILEGDALSANKRFYPLSVVESVKSTLIGKKALIGHDSDSPEDVVAMITASEMSGKKLIGSFRFGKDDKSEMMFQKVKDGLVDSVSIRASGETKPGKVNNEDVDIVQSLDIFSVDFVVEGGVSAAKVMQVFEKAPFIDYNDEQSKKLKEQEKLKMEELQKQLKDLQESNAKLEADKQKLENEKNEAEFKSYVNEKLSSIEDKDIREKVSKLLTGKTKEEIDSQFKAAKEFAEELGKKTGSKIKLEPIKEDDKDGKNEKFDSVNEFMESKNVNKEDKIRVLKALMR